MTRFMTREEYRGSIGLSSGLRMVRMVSPDSGTRIPRIVGHVQIQAGSSWNSLRAGAIRHSLQHGDRIRRAEDAVEFQFLTNSDGRSVRRSRSARPSRKIEAPQHASETAFQDKFSTNPASGHQSILSTARFGKAIFCRLKPVDVLSLSRTSGLQSSDHGFPVHGFAVTPTERRADD
jgi:hypothetical protein